MSLAIELKRTLGRIGLLVTLGSLMPAALAESSQEDWKFSARTYFWLADLNMETVSGQEVEAEFGDVLKELDFAFMGTFFARKNRWSFTTDVMYLKVGVKENISAAIPPTPLELNVGIDFDQETWVITALGGYEIHKSEDAQVDFLFGARNLSVDNEIELDFQVAGRREFSPNSSTTDAIVGIRGTRNLNDRWYLNYYADVGTGDSDFTWQAAAGINYRFSRLDAGLGYRIQDWQLDDNKFLDDYELSGVYLGVRFNIN